MNEDAPAWWPRHGTIWHQIQVVTKDGVIYSNRHTSCDSAFSRWIPVPTKDRLQEISE